MSINLFSIKTVINFILLTDETRFIRFIYVYLCSFISSYKILFKIKMKNNCFDNSDLKTSVSVTKSATSIKTCRCG